MDHLRSSLGYQKTLVTIANKHARIVWAMLAKDERYDASAWQRHPMWFKRLPSLNP